MKAASALLRRVSWNRSRGLFAPWDYSGRKRPDRMQFDSARVRADLQEFDFQRLFIEELGWSRPVGPRPVALTVQDLAYQFIQIAQLSGVVVLQVTAGDGRIPDARTRDAIHRQIAQTYHENLLIFLDGDQNPKSHTQSLWYWVKRDAGKLYPR